MRVTRDARNSYPFWALRRAAQYFFMRSDTSLRIADDIVEPFRALAGAVLLALPAFPALLALLAFRALLALPAVPDFGAAAVVAPAKSSGKACRMAASSRRMSSSRFMAPRRAKRRMSSLLSSVATVSILYVRA